MLRHEQKHAVTIRQIELPTPLPVGSVNSYLLVGEDQRVLVDCGPRLDSVRESLFEGLAAQGYRPEDMTALVLTHGHVDHVGLAREFQSRGVPVYAHPETGTWMDPGGPWDEYRKAFFEKFYTTMGMFPEDIEKAAQEFSLYRRLNDRSVVDIGLADGAVFPPLPMFRVLYVPGHAQHAISLWNEHTGEFLAGDQVLERISSNAFIEPQMNAVSGDAAQRTLSLLDYRRNLKQLSRLGISQVFPGHGSPFGGVQRLLENRLIEQHQRKEDFTELLREHPNSTAFDLAVRFFPRYRHQRTLILSETVGYLDWLYDDDAADFVVDDGGVVRWRMVL